MLLSLVVLVAVGCEKTDEVPRASASVSPPLPPPNPEEGRKILRKGRGGRILMSRGAETVKHRDRNRDGKLQLAELRAAARDILAGADKNGDGILSAEEIDAWRPSAIAERFKGLDESGDGVVNAAEAKGRWPHVVRADKNNDGQLTRDEYVASVLAGDFATSKEAGAPKK